MTRQESYKEIADFGYFIFMVLGKMFYFLALPILGVIGLMALGLPLWLLVSLTVIFFLVWFLHVPYIGSLPVDRPGSLD